MKLLQSCITLNASLSRTMATATVDLKSIFLSAVSAVEPRKLIRERLRLVDRHLLVSGVPYQLDKPYYLVGFGKAVLSMALEVETILGHNLMKGIVTIPKGILGSNTPHQTRIRFIEGAENNLPDSDAMEGAKEIKELVQSLTANELVIVLISGGGSALLPLPLDGITLEEKLRTTKLLAKKGADILELNTVRKRMSQLKGGGLAKLAYPAKVVSLIISDVIGDPVDFIASGPTAVNTDDNKAAMNIIIKYGLYNEISSSVRDCLEEHRVDEVPVVNGKFRHVDNYLIGSNRIAAEAAVEAAYELGWNSLLLSTTVNRDVMEVAQIYSQLVAYCTTFINGKISNNSFVLYLQDLGSKLVDFEYNNALKGLCLVAGGEPTVVVKGKGKGGRNQQLALSFSKALHDLGPISADVWFLSCGTDGIDGPTDAAGAIGGSGFITQSKLEAIDPENYLEDNDSYGFYTRYNGGKNLIKIGHTGTNVMDIHIIFIVPKK